MIDGICNKKVEKRCKQELFQARHVLWNKENSKNISSTTNERMVQQENI